ncbi:MAG: thioesterase family protein [Sphingosinicella sp.]|nr:thioesterase family protein [Sphingosinicella sp.]
MAKLSDALHGFEIQGDHHVIEAPEDWSQGRTLYGGMTTALCYEAAKLQCGPQAQLRSAQMTFVGPASGILTFRADVLRAGKSSTAIAVDCRTGEALAARASFVFGADRSSLIDGRASRRTDLPDPPEACPPFIGATGGFHDNFELKLADGSPLCSGGPLGFRAWTRFREGPGTDP